MSENLEGAAPVAELNYHADGLSDTGGVPMHRVVGALAVAFGVLRLAYFFMRLIAEWKRSQFEAASVGRDVQIGTAAAGAMIVAGVMLMRRTPYARQVLAIAALVLLGAGFRGLWYLSMALRTPLLLPGVLDSLLVPLALGAAAFWRRGTREGEYAGRIGDRVLSGSVMGYAIAAALWSGLVVISVAILVIWPRVLSNRGWDVDRAATLVLAVWPMLEVVQAVIAWQGGRWMRRQSSEGARSRLETWAMAWISIQLINLALVVVRWCVLPGTEADARGWTRMLPPYPISVPWGLYAVGCISLGLPLIVLLRQHGDQVEAWGKESEEGAVAVETREESAG